jgi:uncharacterized membrane protein (UPF0127 family)
MRLVLRLVLLLAVLSPAAAAAQDGETFATSELWIETAAGARHHFAIELALTSAQQAQGLMFRESLAPDAGMLFIFPEARQASFWMKNTLIPLDMMFIGADGRIVNIARRTKPLTTDSVPSEGPVLAVLEVNGGLADLLGIRRGDLVAHEAFGTAPAQE